MRVLGICSGSCRRTLAGVASSAAQAASSSARMKAARGSCLLPVLDHKLRLQLLLPVVDLQLQVLRPDALLKTDGRAALVGAIVRPLPIEVSDQLVTANLQIAQVQALYAALEQGLNLARRIQVVDHFLVIDP